jgi:type VI secretion system protein ImpH
LLFYAGAFATRPRSADRLGALLSDWLGQTVTVEQFAGSWISLGQDQMSALPKGDRSGQFSQLGVDAAIGARAWDIQSRIVLRIGPLPLAPFEALLPGGRLLARLVSLARAYLEGEIGFAINPVLAADAVPPLALQAAAPPNLGWNSWLPTGFRRRRDAADAVFDTQDIDVSGTVS